MSKDSSISDDDSIVFLGIVTPQDCNHNRMGLFVREVDSGITADPNGQNPNSNVGGHVMRARRTMMGNNESNNDGDNSEESTTVPQVRKSADTNFHVGESSKSRKRKTKTTRRKKKKTKEEVLDEMMNKLLRAGWQIGPDKEEKETIFYDLKGRAYSNCIISAYECLKKNYEERKGKGRYYLKSFKFRPMKDDDIKKLLSWKDDRNKKRKRKDEDDDAKPNNNNDYNNKRRKIRSGEDTNKKKQHQLLKTSNKRKEKVIYDDDDDSDEDPNDDTCLLCANGQRGTLICCDGCPSSFHLSCLKITDVPPGDWYCSYCKCKFCGLVIGPTFDNSISVTCSFCEHKYHRSCSSMTGSIKIDHSNNVLCFCSNKCQELFERIKGLLGVKREIGDGFSCTFISGLDAGSTQFPECQGKLFSALKIMSDGFQRGIDHRTGINLIHNVVYSCGSKFNRLNHTMFFTALMEKDDEIICVASLRVHENKVAEMPLITTRPTYRRQGMCTRFLRAIESALNTLGVDLLVIPSVKECEKTWTSMFGYEPFDLETKTRIDQMKLLVSPDSVMLKKNIKRVVREEVPNTQREAINNNNPNTNSSANPVPNNGNNDNLLSSQRVGWRLEIVMKSLMNKHNNSK